MKKRIICALMAAGIAAMALASCGGDGSSSSSGSSAAGDTASASQPETAESGETSAETAIDMEGDPYHVVFMYLNISEGEGYNEVAEAVKRTAFRITRMGELVGREVSRRLGINFGILDLSLAPTPARGDSVADVLEAMGLERCGTHGTTAALALLNDAVKKGGTMASSSVGGLSGAFIPLSEDEEMAHCAAIGALSLDKLEAMTCVCSVGLDMIAVPGDTPATTISGIVADEMAIGMVNNKTTAVRILPVPGKKAGETVDYGGLLGAATIISLNPFSSKGFVERGGHIPAPMQALRN